MRGLHIQIWFKQSAPPMQTAFWGDFELQLSRMGFELRVEPGPPADAFAIPVDPTRRLTLGDELTLSMVLGQHPWVDRYHLRTVDPEAA